MIPKGLCRDAAGMSRLDRIDKADGLVKASRSLVAGVTSTRQLSPTAIATHDEWLGSASAYYRTAGLTLLADRIHDVRQRDLVYAWSRFDEANATTEI